MSTKKAIVGILSAVGIIVAIYVSVLVINSVWEPSYDQLEGRSVEFIEVVLDKSTGGEKSSVDYENNEADNAASQLDEEGVNLASSGYNYEITYENIYKEGMMGGWNNEVKINVTQDDKEYAIDFLVSYKRMLNVVVLDNAIITEVEVEE